jgi:hypothetical protein
MKKLAVLLAAMFLSVSLIHASPCIAKPSASKQAEMKAKMTANMNALKAKKPVHDIKAGNGKTLAARNGSGVNKTASIDKKKAMEAKVAAWKEKAKSVKADVKGGTL